jgi:hypothetical protein
MTINLTWLLPPAMPFLAAVLLRALAWVTGYEIESAALFWASILIGAPFFIVALIAIGEGDIPRCDVRLGRREGGE